MWSVSRPIEVVVLNCWVTLTKTNLMALEHVDQLDEIRQAPAQPVELVGDDDVDQPGLDVGKEPLERRPLQRSSSAFGTPKRQLSGTGFSSQFSPQPVMLVNP